jgi:hypothetical protein
MASSWGLVKNFGAPGTLPVNVPAPTKVWAPPISADPKTQGSNCSPDVWLKDTYYPVADNMGPAADAGIGMALRRHNPLPVPSGTYQLRANKAMIIPKVAGRAALPWPRAFQRFPNYNQSNPYATGS